MPRLFGTDGIRGVANVAPLTAETILEIGRALGSFCSGRPAQHPAIVIGKDTRLSGGMIESALTAGICSVGVDVELIGIMPTPGVAFITREMGASAGVVISASHNPYQDNGIKIFSRDGYKLPDAVEERIEELVASDRVRSLRPTAAGIGRAESIGTAAGRYLKFCRNTYPRDLNLKGMKLVLDCANGATYRVAPAVFSELGAGVTVIHNNPDGLNINDRCGSQYPQDLKAKVREVGADVGLAFDGDGDRLIAVDEEGGELTGDHLLVVCGQLYQERGWLAHDLVVSTVMSNFGLNLALKKLGIKQGVSRVGDRYVLEMMREEGAILGGEPSGHLIFLNHHTTGDGIISALQLLSAIRFYGKPLSQLARIMTLSPQKLISVEVKSKPPLEGIEEVQQAIRAAEAELRGQGRVLIRYSGTQALCRVMVEGPTAEITERLCSSLAAAVKRCVG